MQPAELRVRQAQDRLIFIKDCGIRYPEIGAIGIGAESNPGWSNCRKGFRSVHDRDILLGLIFENAQLGGSILSDGAITIQVVGSEVEPEAYRRAKCAD